MTLLLLGLDCRLRLHECQGVRFGYAADLLLGIVQPSKFLSAVLANLRLAIQSTAALRAFRSSVNGKRGNYSERTKQQPEYCAKSGRVLIGPDDSANDSADNRLND